MVRTVRSPEVLRDLEHQGAVLDPDGQRVQDGRQLGGELHVHHGAEDLGDLADIVLHGCVASLNRG
jgi:hypothetical protein